MKQIKKILVLLFMLVAWIAPGHADVIDQTEKQLKANAQRVKSDADKIMSDVSNMITKAEKTVTDAKDAANIKDLLGQYKDQLKSLKVADLKKLDTKDLQKKIKDITNNVKTIKGLPDDYKKQLDGLTNDIDKLIFDVKNIASVVFTAPVQLKGGYGRAGLCISVDTLRYLRNADSTGNVAIDVKADFQLPFSISEKGGATSIGFRGENVILAGEGESRIKLSLEQGQKERKFKILEGKCSLVLKDESYIAIDCNGFKEMRLDGYFEFDSKVIYPADQSKGDTAIKATFDVTFSDLEDIVIELGIGQKFKVKGTGDVEYQVTGIVADLSTVRNAENFEFPKGYKCAFASGDDAYWTGFAFKLVEIDLSKEVDCLEELDFKAYNMLIDETGFSGWFSAAIAYEGDQKQPTKESSRVDQVVQAKPTKKDEKADKVMSAKIDRLAIGIISNKVNGGELSGSITVKGLKEETKDAKDAKDFCTTLSGKLYTDPNNADKFCYDFKAEVKSGATFNLPFAKDKCKLTLGTGTYIGYLKEPDSTKVKNAAGEDSMTYFYKKGFYFNICGGVDFKAGFVTMEGLKFKDLKFSTYPKYFGGGTFSLDCAKSANLGGLELSLHDLSASLDTTAGNMMAKLNASVKLALISDDDGASVDAKFRLQSDVENNWKVSKVRVEKITVDVHFSAFKLLGSIETFGDETPDEIWGKGYKGDIMISMDKPQFGVSVGARFGRTKESAEGKDDGFKYWYVSGTVTLPDNTALIFPPSVYLKSISVALYSKMGYTSILNCKKVKNLDGAREYRPDASVKWGFWAGIGVYFVKPKLVQAEARLGMDFSSHGGISKLSVDGLVYFLSEKEDDSFIKGQLAILYDFEHDIFKTDADFIADLHGKVKGEGQFHLYVDPDIWYFNLGTVKKQVHLTFMDKINAYTYFMLGDSVPTYLPPLDPELTAKFNVTQSGATATDNSEAFNNGTGFAFGAKLGVDLGPKKFIYANVTLKGGTDALVIRNKTQCGDRDYRGKGQTYLYMDLGAGVKPRKKKFCIVEFSALTMLEAEFPDPYFIVGRVDFRYSVLGGLFSGDAHAKFDIGKHCGPNGELIEGEGFSFTSNKDNKSLKDALLNVVSSGELDDDEKTDLQKEIEEFNKEIEAAKNNDGVGNYDSQTANITDAQKDYEKTFPAKKWNDLSADEKLVYTENYRLKVQAKKEYEENNSGKKWDDLSADQKSSYIEKYKQKEEDEKKELEELKNQAVEDAKKAEKPQENAEEKPQENAEEDADKNVNGEQTDGQNGGGK